MKQEWPKVSLIVPNWNGGDMVLECITSLQNLDYPRKEIVVVDNASTDGSGETLKGIQGVQVIQNRTNLGFGLALNQGVQVTKSPYLLFVNNDARLPRDWLKTVVRASEEDRATALVTGPVEFSEMQGVLWGCGGYVDQITGLAWDAGKGSRELPNDGDLDYLQACALLVRREALEEVGHWDSDYFLYFEDTDLASRLRSVGYRSRILPSATVYHSGLSSPIQSLPERKFYHFVRSNLRFVLKNFSWRYKATSVLSLLSFFALFSLFIVRQISYLGMVGRAVVWNAENLKETLSYGPLPKGVFKIRLGQLINEIRRRLPMDHLFPY